MQSDEVDTVDKVVSAGLEFMEKMPGSVWDEPKVSRRRIQMCDVVGLRLWLATPSGFRGEEEEATWSLFLAE